jgi:hypothetical protein
MLIGIRFNGNEKFLLFEKLLRLAIIIERWQGTVTSLVFSTPNKSRPKAIYFVRNMGRIKN